MIRQFKKLAVERLGEFGKWQIVFKKGINALHIAIYDG